MKHNLSLPIKVKFGGTAQIIRADGTVKEDLSFKVTKILKECVENVQASDKGRGSERDSSTS